MGDFAPPSGPPPPKVPEGWKAQWDDKYKEWFYVNLHTKKSQWDKPTEPARNPNDDDGPPAYSEATNHSRPEKLPRPRSSGMSEDEKLARRLQDEENTNKRGSSKGAASDYYNSGSSGPSQSPNQGSYEQDTRSEGKRGLFSKLLHKDHRPSYPGQPQPFYQQQQQGQQYGGYPQQQQYPPQGYPPQGYPPQGGYYGGGGYPQQQYQQQPQRRHGLGMGGAAALGAGGGLLGGFLLADAFEHEQNQAYDQGYDQGFDNGQYDNGDMGGGFDGGGFDGGDMGGF